MENNSVTLQDLLSQIRAIVREELAVDKKVLTAEQAAQFLNITLPHLYKLTSEHKIPFYRPGKKLYFDREELEVWMLSNRSSSQAEQDQAASTYVKTKRTRKK